MPKQLTLMRHAKSAWGNSGLADIDRSLNERGLKDAPLMGSWLKERGERPSLILCSSALRARETARAIADQLSYPREFMQSEAKLYLASPEQILAVLAAQEAGFNHILLCGHNPGITELVNLLCNSHIDNVPTSGTLSMDADITNWSGLQRSGCSLRFFQAPKTLARGDILYAAK
jgi:phosphohistidine phosphatase